LLTGSQRLSILKQPISFFINCETQEEVDMFWERRSEGGEKSQCGWLKDRWEPVVAGRAERPDEIDG
jgi:predicted 3-demethylubiquinone-9 3-methyltransferase (glyoxalase superfamily)